MSGCWDSETCSVARWSERGTDEHACSTYCAISLHRMMWVDVSYLAKCWLVVEPRTAISVSTCTDFKVERTVDSGIQ